MLTSRRANLDHSKYDDGAQWRLQLMAKEVGNHLAKVVIVIANCYKVTNGRRLSDNFFILFLSEGILKCAPPNF